MKTENCAGALVYRVYQGQLEILLIKSAHGFWGFPKGHLEPDETPERAAQREILEETHVSVELETDFCEVSTYVCAPSTLKTVYYYAARCLDCAQQRPQPGEVEALAWCSLNQAHQQLTYANDRHLLSLFAAYWHQKPSEKDAHVSD